MQSIIPSPFVLQGFVDNNQEKLSNSNYEMREAQNRVLSGFILFLFNRYSLEAEFKKSVNPYVDIPVNRKQMIDLLKREVKNKLVKEALINDLPYHYPIDTMILKDLVNHFLIMNFILEYSYRGGFFRLYLNTDEGISFAKMEKPQLQKSESKKRTDPPRPRF